MGVAMYVFAIIYPLEKKHNLQLELVALEEQAALLDKNLDDLQREYEDLAIWKGKLEAKYDSAKLTKNHLYISLILAMLSLTIRLKIALTQKQRDLKREISN